MAKWNRFKSQEEVLGMKHLFQIVNMGGTVSELYPDDDKPIKGISLKLPEKVHERLDIITKSIPGMTKEKLVRFMVDAAIFEYAKALVESSLFPPEDDEQNSAESLIDEAMEQIKTEVR